MKREVVKKLMEEKILGSSDVQEMLMINRSRLGALVEAGKLEPIKELKRESLFWLPDVEQLRKEMMLDTRTNLYKKASFKGAEEA
jgi:hypothetical protein